MIGDLGAVEEATTMPYLHCSLCYHLTMLAQQAAIATAVAASRMMQENNQVLPFRVAAVPLLDLPMGECCSPSVSMTSLAGLSVRMFELLSCPYGRWQHHNAAQQIVHLKEIG